jgi:uncharacterized RDD family membrane protein YckC
MTNPYAPPQTLVQDVIDPTAGIQLADRGTRLGASILDGLILGLLVYVPLIVGAIPGLAAARATGGNEFGTGMWVGIAVAAAGLIAWLWFTIKFLGENGQSIGKKACGIKLLRTDGSEVSISRVIVARNLVNGLLGVVPLYGFIDALFIFGNARRCVHDHLADTIVIKA